MGEYWSPAPSWCGHNSLVNSAWGVAGCNKELETLYRQSHQLELLQHTHVCNQNDSESEAPDTAYASLLNHSLAHLEINLPHHFILVHSLKAVRPDADFSLMVHCAPARNSRARILGHALNRSSSGKSTTRGGV